MSIEIQITIIRDDVFLYVKEYAVDVTSTHHTLTCHTNKINVNSAAVDPLA